MNCPSAGRHGLYFFSGKLTYNFHPTEGHNPSLLVLSCISSFCVWLSSGYPMSIDWCHAPRHCCVSLATTSSSPLPSWHLILGLQRQWCHLAAHQSSDRCLLGWCHLWVGVATLKARGSWISSTSDQWTAGSHLHSQISLKGLVSPIPAEVVSHCQAVSPGVAVRPLPLHTGRLHSLAQEKFPSLLLPGPGPC